MQVGTALRAAHLNEAELEPKTLWLSARFSFFSYLGGSNLFCWESTIKWWRRCCWILCGGDHFMLQTFGYDILVSQNWIDRIADRGRIKELLLHTFWPTPWHIWMKLSMCSHRFFCFFVVCRFCFWSVCMMVIALETCQDNLCQSIRAFAESVVDDYLDYYAEEESNWSEVGGYKELSKTLDLWHFGFLNFSFVKK